MPGKVGRPGGPPRISGTLSDWCFVTLFGAVLVRGWLDGRRFTAEVRCLDGDGSNLSMLWTNDGRVRITPADRARALSLS